MLFRSTNGSPAKIFTVNDCVLENVNIEYAPNGWAAYGDGYPVQTIISLDFKETTVYTKNQMAQTAVAANYALQQEILPGINGVGFSQSQLNPSAEVVATQQKYGI